MIDRFSIKLWDKLNNKIVNLPVTTLYQKAEVEPHRFDMLQCTGLKDFQGSLIYEGDILEIQEIGLRDTPVQLLVEWNDQAAGFTFEDITEPNGSFDFGGEICSCTTIIGNVLQTKAQGEIVRLEAQRQAEVTRLQKQINKLNKLLEGKI